MRLVNHPSLPLRGRHGRSRDRRARRRRQPCPGGV